MNWQSYVDDRLIGTGNVSQAAICGQSGGVWAASAGFMLSSFEIRDIADAYDDLNMALAGGIHIGDDKYFVIYADGRSIYGRRMCDALCIVKTMKTFLICISKEGIQPDNCNKTVEALGDLLISQGY